MKRILILILFLFVLIPAIASAQETRLISNMTLKYTLPSDRWEVSSEAPELAIEAMVVDMVHGRKKAGKEVNMAEIRSQAEKFIQTNNFYIYNERTEAYLMVSLSPHKADESPLSPKAVSGSVSWTIEALQDHSDVADLTPYRSEVRNITIPGMEYIEQVTSDLPLFGEPHNFIGIIGYTYPYWIFMFYNDKAKDPDDLQEMQQIIRSLELSIP